MGREKALPHTARRRTVAFADERLHPQHLCLLGEGTGSKAALVIIEQRERTVGVAARERRAGAIEERDLLGQ